MLRKPGFSPIPSRRRNSSKDGSKEGMYLQFNRIYIILALLFVVLPLAFLFHTTYKRSLHISPTIRSRNSPLHPTDSDVDCVVYISYHRSHGHVELALSNLRSRGGYQGPVYLITDKPEDWSDPSITAVLASKSDIGKQLKTRILHYTPESCVNVLYMDTDALFVKTALRPIKEGEATTPLRVELESAFLSLSSSISSSVMALFLDSGGHAMGMCSGCDRWHTGVMGVKRGRSEHVLRDWEEEIRKRMEEGLETTDQAALDKTISLHSRYDIALLGYDHLLFMRDYIRRKVGYGENVEIQHYTGLGEGNEWEEEIRGNFGIDVKKYFPETRENEDGVGIETESP